MKTKTNHQAVKQFVVLALALATMVAVSADAVLLDTLKINGMEVKNVRVSASTPTTVTILYDGGGSQLNRRNLPSELAALFPYDAKAAARYDEEQEKERQERVQRERVRQAQANQEWKNALLRQRQSVMERREVLHQEETRLEQQVSLAWSKAARRPRSPERQEYNRLVEQKQELLKKSDALRDMVTKIDRQLSVIP